MKITNKVLVCSVALLMLASAGATSSNVVNVNAKHVRTHRVVRHHRRHSRKAVKRYNHKRNVHKYNVHKLNHRKNARRWRVRYNHKRNKRHFNLRATVPESRTKAYKEGYKQAYKDPEMGNTLEYLLQGRHAFNKGFYDGAYAGCEKVHRDSDPDDLGLYQLRSYENFAKQVLNNKDSVYRQGAWDNSTNNDQVSPKYYTRNDYKSAWKKANNWGFDPSDPRGAAQGDASVETAAYNYAVHNSGLN